MERAAAAVDKVAYAYDHEADPKDAVCFSCSFLALIMDRLYAEALLLPCIPMPSSYARHANGPLLYMFGILR